MVDEYISLVARSVISEINAQPGGNAGCSRSSKDLVLSGYSVCTRWRKIDSCATELTMPRMDTCVLVTSIASLG